MKTKFSLCLTVGSSPTISIKKGARETNRYKGFGMVGGGLKNNKIYFIFATSLIILDQKTSF